jgi:hypothetical protein
MVGNLTSAATRERSDRLDSSAGFRDASKKCYGVFVTTQRERTEEGARADVGDAGAGRLAAFGKPPHPR